MPWAPNWVAAHPHGAKLMAVVGDDPVGFLMDASTGQQVSVAVISKDFCQNIAPCQLCDPAR